MVWYTLELVVQLLVAWGVAVGALDRLSAAKACAYHGCRRFAFELSTRG